MAAGKASPAGRAAGVDGRWPHLAVGLLVVEPVEQAEVGEALRSLGTRVAQPKVSDDPSRYDQTQVWVG